MTPEWLHLFEHGTLEQRLRRLEQVRADATLDDLAAAQVMARHGGGVLRVSALEACARVPDWDRCGFVVRFLPNRGRLARKAAAELLGRLACACAVEPLLARLAVEQWEVARISIVTALGEIGDARALAPLEAFLLVASPVEQAHCVRAIERLTRAV